MRLRSSRLLVPLVCAVVLLVFLFALLIVRAAAPTQPRVVWSAISTAFSASDQSDIQRALAPVTRASYSDQPGASITILSAQRQGDFAVLYVTQGDTGSEPLLLLAHRTQGHWTVWSADSAGFCEQLKLMPETLLSAEEKSYYWGCRSA